MGDDDHRQAMFALELEHFGHKVGGDVGVFVFLDEPGDVVNDDEFGLVFFDFGLHGSDHPFGSGPQVEAIGIEHGANEVFAKEIGPLEQATALGGGNGHLDSEGGFAGFFVGKKDGDFAFANEIADNAAFGAFL